MSRKEKKYHFIYKTIDTRNENFYIGMHSTDDLNDGYVGSGTRLRRLIYKHGKSIFTLEILEQHPDRESLKKREEELINFDLLKEEKCMNLKPGGYGGFCNEDHRKLLFLSNKNISSEVRKKARNKQKELWKNNPILFKEFCLNLSNSKKGNKSWTGLHHTEKNKEKIGISNSIKQKGELNSQFGTCWITNGIDTKKIKKIDLHLYPNWRSGRTL